MMNTQHLMAELLSKLLRWEEIRILMSQILIYLNVFRLLMISLVIILSLM